MQSWSSKCPAPHLFTATVTCQETSFLHRPRNTAAAENSDCRHSSDRYSDYKAKRPLSASAQATLHLTFCLLALFGRDLDAAATLKHQASTCRSCLQLLTSTFAFVTVSLTPDLWPSVALSDSGKWLESGQSTSVHDGSWFLLLYSSSLVVELPRFIPISYSQYCCATVMFQHHFLSIQNPCRTWFNGLTV